MTEVEFPLTEPPVDWRGRLQRRLRRDRTRAPGDALVGAAVSALLVLALNAGSAEVGSATAEAAPAETAAADQAVFTAAMVGDVMFARHVERVAGRHGYDALLREVAPLLQADYVSANLEQVISDRDDLPEADKLIHLASDERALDALSAAGFTTLSLANNHTMDHGLPGLEDTIVSIEAAGLRHAGAGADLDAAVRVDLQEHGDLVVATLSFTDAYVQGFIARAFQGGVLDAEPETFVPLIQRADVEADLVIAHFHWGEEYDIGPSARQRELAEIAAAAGADVIVGHHPHVLLPVEMVGGTLVFYSLGNFVFDQGWSRTRESAIARYTLRDDGTAQVEMLPVYLREATPRLVQEPRDAYRRARILQRLRGGDGLDWRREGDGIVAEVGHRIDVGAGR